MAHLARYLITSPETSKAFVDAIRTAIDSGTRSIPITAYHPVTNEQIESEFVLRQSRYSDHVRAHYAGSLGDYGIATVSAYTHPDMSDTPAQLTFVRQTTAP